MARVAKQDTYGMEDVGGGVEVRRRIVAGQKIPDQYVVDDADVQEIDEGVAGIRTYGSRVLTEAKEDPPAPEANDDDDDDDEAPAEPHARRGRRKASE